MHKAGKFEARNENYFQVCSTRDYFFRQHRKKTFCKSKRPTSEVERKADYSKSFWMRHFFDGTIDMSRQSNPKGCAILTVRGAEDALAYDNPLRDPVMLIKRLDGEYELKDGFHRIHEAYARGYSKRVWTLVLDDAIEISETDEEDD